MRRAKPGAPSLSATKPRQAETKDQWPSTPARRLPLVRLNERGVAAYMS
jgi:hypothetical protein